LDSKRVLQQQFRAHSIERRYDAIVHGRIERAFTAETDLIRDRGDGLKGSFGHFRRPRGPLPADAQHAITHVRPIEALWRPGPRAERDATLIECQLETGRQHQIRIHVSERNHPIVGEQVYIRDFKSERINAERPMLHARTLGFEHPRTGKPVQFSIDPPLDFQTLLIELRPRRQ
jgi:23S rRNA pseudouridine1911/1915/1917 synthase